MYYYTWRYTQNADACTHDGSLHSVCNGCMWNSFLFFFFVFPLSSLCFGIRDHIT